MAGLLAQVKEYWEMKHLYSVGTSNPLGPQRHLPVVHERVVDLKAVIHNVDGRFSI